jgi:hypothetical protein
MKSTRLLLICGALCIATSLNAQDTLRVMSYNGLNFSSSSTDRLDDFRKVFWSAHPDIIVMQEIIDATAVNNLLNQSVRVWNPAFEACTFANGPDTDNACFYNSDYLEFVSQRQISTSLRDFTEYVFTSTALSDGEVIRFYSGHLKAGDTDSDAARRVEECDVLRGELEELSPNSLFMFMGDFNLYTSFEDAYQLLLSPLPSLNGQLYDPLNRPGEWHNSVSFADIHTQSPRVVSFGGGSTGGMDDRFDFILASLAWIDTTASKIIPGTYKAYGNDGLHFNLAINDGSNEAVPDSVADALHEAADHLPVVVDIVLRPGGTPVGELPPVTQSAKLLRCYPNPFNQQLTVEIAQGNRTGALSVYDIVGRRIMNQTLAAGPATAQVSLDFAGRATGTYLVVLMRENATETKKVHLIK